MSKKKKIWIACGVAVVLGLIIFFSIRATRKDEVPVQTSKVIRKDVLKAQVSASGQIRAKDYVNLQAEIVGVVTDLRVREGDKVKKGDILLKIDPIQTAAQEDSTRAQSDAAHQDLRAQQFQISIAEHNIANAKSQLDSSRAQAEQATANVARSQSSFNRSQQLNEEGLISRDEYEQAQNNLNAAKSQAEVAKKQVEQMANQIKISENSLEQMQISYAAAETRLKSQDANLTQATDQLKKTTITSSLNGVITQLVVHAGERAVPGTLNSPQATLMTISDLSVIQTELKVDETDIVSLAIGNPAKIKVDALPDIVLDGEVTEIGNSPITTSGSTTQEAKDFKVIVTVKNPPDKIRPGMSCTADIITETRNNILAIPIQALTIREVEVDKDGNYIEPDPKQKKKTDSVARADSTKTKINKKELEGVFVITKDNHAKFRPVKTGITGESEIEVKSNLQEGEVIVSGSFQTLRTLKDGAIVKVETTPTKAETTKSPS
ncbi:MAG: efflux RND transporter periplasmic adaptor subunit [Acidobacteriia bacterium]|nr:efflux RND transporter periplasmic adaptor subunit [Terriglobia bacterium]